MFLIIFSVRLYIKYWLILPTYPCQELIIDFFCKWSFISDENISWFSTNYALKTGFSKVPYFEILIDDD